MPFFDFRWRMRLSRRTRQPSRRFAWSTAGQSPSSSTGWRRGPAPLPSRRDSTEYLRYPGTRTPGYYLYTKFSKPGISGYRTRTSTEYLRISIWLLDLLIHVVPVLDLFF